MDLSKDASAYGTEAGELDKAKGAKELVVRLYFSVKTLKNEKKKKEKKKEKEKGEF